MSETSTETPQPQADAKQGDPASTDKALGPNGEKALNAERDRAKQLERQLNATESELARIKDAQMTDLERAQKAAAEAQDQVKTARVEALRYRIAAKHGIDDTDAELFLTGSDEDTMSRQAARLLERAPASPRPDASQGARSGDIALNGDPLLRDLKAKLGIT